MYLTEAFEGYYSIYSLSMNINTWLKENESITVISISHSSHVHINDVRYNAIILYEKK
jgi:hypothetical protein